MCRARTSCIICSLYGTCVCPAAGEAVGPVSSGLHSGEISQTQMTSQPENWALQSWMKGATWRGQNKVYLNTPQISQMEAYLSTSSVKTMSQLHEMLPQENVGDVLAHLLPLESIRPIHGCVSEEPSHWSGWALSSVSQWEAIAPMVLCTYSSCTYFLESLSLLEAVLQGIGVQQALPSQGALQGGVNWLLFIMVLTHSVHSRFVFPESFKYLKCLDRFSFVWV